MSIETTILDLILDGDEDTAMEYINAMEVSEMRELKSATFTLNYWLNDAIDAARQEAEHPEIPC